MIGQLFSRISPAWRLRIAAVAAGLAAGVAHPPFGFLPGLLGYAVLLRVLDAPAERPLRQAFFRAWLAGVGYFSVGVGWITEPFLVDAATYGWMAPFALLAMGGGLALFWGLAGLVYSRLSPGGWRRLFVFAGALTLAEFARGHVLTGFPWDLPGETWLAGSAPSQAAALMGVYALSWVTIALAAAPALLLTQTSRRDRAVIAGGIAATLALLYGGGAWRLSQSPKADPGAPMVRLVQANIDQKEKWRPENLDAVFDAYLDLTTRPAARTPDIVVWPEGALPAVIDDLLSPNLPYVWRLTAALKPGQILMMGANRAGAGPDGKVAYYNSLIALRRDPDGLRLLGYYDKHRLVPFGEFLPLGDLAGRIGLRSLVHMPEDFTAGPEPRPLVLDGAPALQPMICYEALFPRFAARANLRPYWLLNVSNDAWFGGGRGPLQHLNIASYRAIEEGLPLARATPTGVTVMVDAYGRSAPAARLGPGAYGVVDSLLPPRIARTTYGGGNETILAILLLVSLAMAAPRPAKN